MALLVGSRPRSREVDEDLKMKARTLLIEQILDLGETDSSGDIEALMDQLKEKTNEMADKEK